MTKGQPRSEETKKKISRTLMGHPGALRGKHRSDETKMKISLSHKGVKLSDEHRKHLSESHMGYKVPEERKERMRIKMRGVNNPAKRPEIREKISLSKRGPKNAMYGKVGVNSHSWKGGISFEPYCPKFNNKFKERVRAFFNYTCQICGHVWQEGEKRLAVHHVNYDKMICCNSMKPLFVPICSGKCHSKTNFNREYWEETLTNKILLEYDGECYIKMGVA